MPGPALAFPGREFLSSPVNRVRSAALEPPRRAETPTAPRIRAACSTSPCPGLAAARACRAERASSPRADFAAEAAGLSATFRSPVQYCDSMHRESDKKCSSSRGAMQGPAESQAGRGFPGRHAIVHAKPDCHASQPRRAIGVVLDAHLVCLSPAFERVSEREVHMPMIAAAPDLVDPKRRLNRPPFDIGVATAGCRVPRHWPHSKRQASVCQIIVPFADLLAGLVKVGFKCKP